MIHEFAVEPAVLSTWDQFRYFSENFGMEQGRLISRFPKRWKKLVYEACATISDVERKRIETRLGQESFDRKLLNKGRQYDSDHTWLVNAEAHQGTADPFRAIIATDNPRACDAVRLAAELDQTDILWTVNREDRIPRTATALAAASSKLLQYSRAVLIVDPYFDPSVPRFLNVFRAFVNELGLPSRLLRRFELHTSNQRSGTTDHWGDICRARLLPLLSEGNTLRVVRWSQRPGGEVFHARYVLSDLGGIRFEAGLDEGPNGETTDVSLLNSNVREARWRDFPESVPAAAPQTTTYVRVDEFVVSHNSLSRIYPQ